ncbi:hypothetical protein J4H92_10750 [Leucobacter weissii]|uniref:RNA polymerase sigma-70 region 2 domain-containing protein n=2 Tax=Leucobacter weissii TaxID=1983706 RepID=A0A939S8S8_9MICO|nr:hypothetical protein [Leucobacter weissii]
MPDPPPAEAVRERRILLGLSYRLLGSVADAEDCVQETYIRWYRLDEEERRGVSSPLAWLITTASRIGLDMLTTARARRERYIGEWLPEPVPGSGLWNSQGGGGSADDPADRISMDDSVSMAIVDGGGLVSAALEPLSGAGPIARFLLGVFERQPGLLLREELVNGEPGLVAGISTGTGTGDEILAVISLALHERRISRLWTIRNPEKLTPWQR